MQSSPIPPRDAQRLFAANVKRVRKLRGLTQEELAELAQLQPSYVSSVERGVRNITLSNMERLAVALKVTIAELVS